MKALIWIGCLFCAGLVQTLLAYAGVGGALPAMAVFAGMIFFARYFCGQYEESQRNKESAKGAKAESGTSSYYTPKLDEQPTEKPVVPPTLYCRKCGKKLIEGSDFCSYCGTPIVKE